MWPTHTFGGSTDASWGPRSPIYCTCLLFLFIRRYPNGHDKIRGSLGRNVEDVSRNGRRRGVGYSRPNKYPRGANLDFQGDDLLLARGQGVCLNITQLALLIIGKCGFGFQFSWAEPARTADGRMAVQEALRISADSFKVSLFVPWWLKLLPLKRSVGNTYWMGLLVLIYARCLPGLKR